MKTNLLHISTTVLIALVSSLHTLGQQISSESLYLEALKYYNIGEFSNAEKVFGDLLVKNPSNDAAYYYLADIYIRNQDPAKAEKFIISAVELDPTNMWYQFKLAEIYRVMGKNDEAIEVYDRLRAEEPRNPDLYEGLIDLHILNENYEKALEVISDVETYFGANEFTGLVRYNLMIYEGKRQEAMSFLEEFDKEYGSPRTATILGDYYGTLGNDSLAIRYYSQALSLDPGYIWATFGLAESYRLRNEFDLYFEKMNIFMADAHIPAEMKTSYIGQLMANPQFVYTFLPEVDTLMRTLYAVNYRDSTVAYEFGIFMAQTENSEDALSAFRNNAMRYPDSKSICVQYLSYLHYMGEWHALQEESAKALILFRNDTDILQLSAIAEFNLEQIHKSLIIFKEILKHTSDSATIVNTLNTIGDLSYSVGNKKEAYKYYERTIKMEPRQLPALNNYAYYLSLDGKKLKKARKMSYITIEDEPNNPTYLDTYAWILHLMGENAEAKTYFRHAMVYGGKEHAEILYHYAEVLFALGEYDLASIYWEQADSLDPSLGVAEKAEARKKEMKR